MGPDARFFNKLTPDEEARFEELMNDPELAGDDDEGADAAVVGLSLASFS